MGVRPHTCELVLIGEKQSNSVIGSPDTLSAGMHSRALMGYVCVCAQGVCTERVFGILIVHLLHTAGMGRLTKEDRSLIWNLRRAKRWGSRRMVKEFPNQLWARRSIDRLIKKIDTTGGTERKRGSGRPRSARTEDNIATVSAMISSQEDAPHTHRSPREIERETGISRSSVQRIAKEELDLKIYKRIKAQKLNEACKLKRLQRNGANCLSVSSTEASTSGVADFNWWFNSKEDTLRILFPLVCWLDLLTTGN